MRGQQVMEPIFTRTREDGGRIVLALDNGVRIECGGPTEPGHYILVANAEGVEIGYWNTGELSDPEVMREVMTCAVTGKPPCEHEWVDATNEAVSNTEYCSKCGRLRALKSTQPKGDPCMYCNEPMHTETTGRTWCENPECPGNVGNPR